MTESSGRNGKTQLLSQAHSRVTWFLPSIIVNQTVTKFRDIHMLFLPSEIANQIHDKLLSTCYEQKITRTHLTGVTPTPA